MDSMSAADANSFRVTSVVYDLGNSMSCMFGTRTGPNTWEMNGGVDGARVQGGVAGVPQLIPLGNLTFNQDVNSKLRRSIISESMEWNEPSSFR